MTNEMSIYVCDTTAQAATATQFLIKAGYPVSGITDEPVAVFIYDAETYDGGKSDDLAKKFVVIGRK